MFYLKKVISYFPQTIYNINTLYTKLYTLDTLNNESKFKMYRKNDY